MRSIKKALALVLCLLLCISSLPGGLPVLAATDGRPTISLNEAFGEPDGHATVSVELSDNPGLIVIRLALVFDKTLLTLESIEYVGPTTGGSSWEQSGLYALWLGTANSSYTGEILKLTFHVPATAVPGDIPVTVRCGEGDVADMDEESFIPVITPGRVHIHDWAEPAYVWAADYGSVTATLACTLNDDHNEVETVDAQGEVTKEATCTEDGERTWTSAAFTNSAFSIQTTKETLSAIGHDWGEPTYEWAADNTSVTAKRVCANDASHVEEETVSATGEVTTEPTCTEAGEKTWTSAGFTNGAFSVQTTKEPVEALGHDFGDWTVTTPATCTEAGEETRTCSRCKTVETREIAALGHTVVIDNAVAATCTETGLTEGSHCSACNAVLVEQQIVPALDHDYQPAVTEPTCTEQGYTTYTCSRCSNS
jgi:hypothetical protein